MPCTYICVRVLYYFLHETGITRAEFSVFAKCLRDFSDYNESPDQSSRLKGGRGSNLPSSWEDEKSEFYPLRNLVSLLENYLKVTVNEISHIQRSKINFSPS